MPDADDGAATEPASVPTAALRRCPGCHNQVTTQTPYCPVCGKHATFARLASALRWTVIAAGTAAAGWWWLHR
jgi:uncharacterized paraquat-inducible protein A